MEYLLYIGLFAVLMVPYSLRRQLRNRRSRAALAASAEAGLLEPPSLHPLIDESRCLGCATCVTACPEGDVLGLLHGKAVMVNPANCIGHGACKDACPQDAITLVLGTEQRGVDIPVLDPDFQTNVPGLFVAGELGGMGLIRNAIEQGRQAVDSVIHFLETAPAVPGALDLVIVGAGPAGFSATLAAQQAGLSHRTLEQETLGGTVAHYPRGKIVMTAPVDLPLHGKVKLRETSKEALLALWQEVEAKQRPAIHYQQRIDAIRALPRGGFALRGPGGEWLARAVLLAIGRRGTPRKLEVEGEEQEKVVYRLVDPEQYRGCAVLVVGGGDSALEAAIALNEVEGTEVTLSYRGDAFSRAKAKNRERLEAAQHHRRLRVELGSQVERITARSVRLATRHGSEELPNDAVVVCAGGVLPTGFLREIGVDIERKHGTA